MKMESLSETFLRPEILQMPTCPGVKADGEVCGKTLRGEAIRCGTHMNTLETYGPHATAQRELGYRHRGIYRRFIDEHTVRINAEPDLVRKQRLTEDMNLDSAALKLAHRREMEMLVREHQDEVRRTGIDPDAQARERRERENRERIIHVRARMEQRRIENQARFEAELRADLAAQQALNRIQNNLQNAEQAIQNANQVIRDNQQNAGQELRRFALDNQNVHTSFAVQRTTDMVNKLLSIPVPPEYRWNMSECSKTPGDIIMCCNLTPKGGWQMMAKYCQDENIYELGRGIYGRVLDGVWQYILKSPDKTDICRILKQEMEDNIGMCAQGNLTRLCNILAGYMDGMGPQESPAEVLGRKLPLLMNIEDDDERLKNAYNLFVELKIPESEWVDWAQPLVDSTIRLQSDAAGRVIGLVLA